jgi:hypothetical protein
MSRFLDRFRRSPASKSPARKQFRLSAREIRPLAEGHGGCIATDRITVHGELVGFMQRDEPVRPEDSGWAFSAGSESQDYLDDPANSGVYDVNTIANYDPEIIPFLEAPIGSRFVRWPPGGPLGPEPSDRLS